MAKVLLFLYLCSIEITFRRGTAVTEHTTGMIKKFNPETISSTLEVFTRSQSAYLAIFMMGVAHVTSSVLSWQISVTAYCISKDEAYAVRETLLRYQKDGDKILIDHIDDDTSNFWTCEMRFNILTRFVKE